MNIYLVTDGNYSDYHICGAFSTLEKAAEAKILLVASNEVESYEIDAIPEHPPGMFAFKVEMDKSGNVRHAEPVSIEDFEARFVYYGITDWTPLELTHFYQYAHDEKHAVKIANEKRIQLLAEGQWGGDSSEDALWK